MTSRNLFFKLMKEDLKRRLWVVTLIGLGCFFMYPVAAAFMAGSIEEYAPYFERGMQVYKRNLESLLSFESGLTAFGMTVAALICGLSSFSYLISTTGFRSGVRSCIWTNILWGFCMWLCHTACVW